MREIKFTTDGKKVVVIGNLNSQEKIVQEIFIVGGSEIPSGEHFVVKSLHDTPAVSWKEKELKRLEEIYNSDKEKYETDIGKLKKDYRLKCGELRLRLQYIGSALKNANESSFNTLVDFITGEIEWVVVDNYDVQLLPINEFHQMYEDELRLISLFGRDDGSFTYAIGDYSDYSGGKKLFHPFKTYEDAVLKLKDIVLNKGVNIYTIAASKKYGITFPDEQIKSYKEKELSSIDKTIKHYTDEADNLKRKKDEISGL